MIIDVTQRKQNELALIQSEIKFKTLFESTHDAIAILKEGYFIDCNQASLDLFGCSSVVLFCNKTPADLSPSRQPCGSLSDGLAIKKCNKL